MPEMPRLWMRHEPRLNERRAPISPEDARRLAEHGIEVTVEESAQRIFPISAYAAAGCRVAPQTAWVRCTEEHYVIGLKELPGKPSSLRHRHIFFGHAYKGQLGARRLLERFAAGGGALLDMEYLVDENGHRLAAFGYWAGYAGAALAVLHRSGLLAPPLSSFSKDELDARLRASRYRSPAIDTTAVVIGAHGRGGRGACDALEMAGIEPTRWDSADTEELDSDALIAHDVLVNAIGSVGPVRPFLTEADLDEPARRLSVLCDVTCDVASEFNALPVYDKATNWDRPVQRLRDGERPLDLIAIDNLPSLIPAEASRDFSAQLCPLLLSLGDGSPVWERSLRAFHLASSSIGSQAAGSSEMTH
ncbi:saccharopine dehydrogenase [Streptomyces sp. NPDC002122]|uniref:saccharopine dehydrogenase n=1 Tax=Streptomyces sp. NPDC002122 TaxID=3154407 RepID=UPI00331BFF18